MPLKSSRILANLRVALQGTICRRYYCSLNKTIKEHREGTEGINISAVDTREFLINWIYIRFSYRACCGSLIHVNTSEILEIKPCHLFEVTNRRVLEILCGQVDWQILIIRSHNTFLTKPTQSCFGSQSHSKWKSWLKMNLP